MTYPGCTQAPEGLQGRVSVNTMQSLLIQPIHHQLLYGDLTGDSPKGLPEDQVANVCCSPSSTEPVISWQWGQCRVAPNSAFLWLGNAREILGQPRTSRHAALGACPNPSPLPHRGGCCPQNKEGHTYGWTCEQSWSHGSEKRGFRQYHQKYASRNYNF